MKFTSAIFFVIATICFFDIVDAINNAGTAAITRLKSETTTTKNVLDRYGRNLMYNLNSKLSNQINTELANINAIVNPAAAEIRSSIDAAKSNGKDAEHCYEPARLALRQASFIDANKELNECRNTGVSTMNPVKSNIDRTVQLGSSIINDLDAITINCLSNANYQNCIIAQIPSASSTVQGYQNTANELKRTAESSMSSVLTTALGCNQSATQKVRQAATDVRSSAKNCIANS